MHDLTARQNAMPSLDLARVVHLAHIDNLLAAGPGNFLRVALAHKSLVGGLDCVHLIPGSVDSRSEVVDAGSAAHFVNQMLGAETEAWKSMLVYNWE